MLDMLTLEDKMELIKREGISTDEVLSVLENILSAEDVSKIKILDMKFNNKNLFMGKIITIPHIPPLDQPDKNRYIELLRKQLPGNALRGGINKAYLLYYALFEPISLDYVLKDYEGLVELTGKKEGRRIRTETVVRYQNEGD